MAFKIQLPAVLREPPLAAHETRDRGTSEVQVGGERQPRGTRYGKLAGSGARVAGRILVQGILGATWSVESTDPRSSGNARTTVSPALFLLQSDITPARK